MYIEVITVALSFVIPDLCSTLHLEVSMDGCFIEQVNKLIIINNNRYVGQAISNMLYPDLVFLAAAVTWGVGGKHRNGIILESKGFPIVRNLEVTEMSRNLISQVITCVLHDFL